MRLLVYLLFCISILACSKSGSQSIATGSSATVPTLPTITNAYLALGDSYTIGQSVTENERFPAQLANFLQSQAKNIGSPNYVATTGWTTIDLQNAINNQNLQPKYDIITLLIGVNDQYQHLDTGGYAIRFRQLLLKAITLAKDNKQHVFVLSIPDYSATPFVPAAQKPSVSKEIDFFNSINKRITDSLQVSYTDITPASRQAATNPSLIANDGLHPSGLQYKLWVDLLAPKVAQVL